MLHETLRNLEADEWEWHSQLYLALFYRRHMGLSTPPFLAERDLSPADDMLRAETEHRIPNTGHPQFILAG